MSAWDSYPAHYRAEIVQAIVGASQAGECSALIGLSGSGKSNLMGFLAHRLGWQSHLPGIAEPHPAFVLADCNRLSEKSPQALFALLLNALEQAAGGEPSAPPQDYFQALERQVRQTLENVPGVCFLLDRFDALSESNHPGMVPAAFSSNLRALRDAHKYGLTYVLASRTPLTAHDELAELFYAHTLWLGPLSREDAVWNIKRYAERIGQTWEPAVFECILELSGGYPSFLRAVCEAYAAGSDLNQAAITSHPAVQLRLAEFWDDRPSEAALQHSGLASHPLLQTRQKLPIPESNLLTAKEHLLWSFLQAHPGQVCDKDELIRAVWPEDRIFERGIRDDSLAQLVRRLREKVELEPSAPQHIHTVPGRGYRYLP